MLSNQVIQLKEYLTKCLGVKVEIFNDKVDGGFCGITDKYNNYAYIRKRGGVKQYTYQELPDRGCDIYRITADYQLIVDLDKKIDLSQAHQSVSQCLRNCPFGTDLQVKIVSSGDDSDEIYKQETGAKDWKDCNHFLLCFDFRLSDIVDCGCGINPVACLVDLMG